MSKNEDKVLAVVCGFLLIFSVIFFSVIKSTEVEDEIVTEALEVTRTYTVAGIAPNMNADTLYGLLNDENISNDPFILSIRSVDHYALGHIPGAINIALNTLFSEENLAKLPSDRQIVVYCYTGHTASQATALLNVNGYNAVCLTWGMCSWTADATVTVGKCFNAETAAHEYAFVSGNESGGFPAIVGTIISPRIVTLEPLGCGGDIEPVEEVVIASDSDTLSDTTYLSLNQGKPAVMKADVLYANLNDGDTSNDPFVLSVRKPEHYTLGHIPGAIHIGIADLFTQKGLAQLPDDDQQIVVVCYTGHSASQTTALLNLNGYNATALMWGMCSWTTNSTVTAGKCFNATAQAYNYSYRSGIWDEKLQKTIHDSLQQGKPVAVTAESVYIRLTDDDPTNDPFLLSIRKAEDYQLGHIPGAVNIGLSSLFTEENLAKLPYDRQIITVCYTGHSASQAAALLNALSFNATALKWGMCSWTTNSTVTVGKCYDSEVHAQDYPYTAGSDPGYMP